MNGKNKKIQPLMFFIENDDLETISRFSKEIREVIKAGECLVLPNNVKVKQLKKNGEWKSLN